MHRVVVLGAIALGCSSPVVRDQPPAPTKLLNPDACGKLDANPTG
jgi:hypothetical protein